MVLNNCFNDDPPNKKVKSTNYFVNIFFVQLTVVILEEYSSYELENCKENFTKEVQFSYKRCALLFCIFPR